MPNFPLAQIQQLQKELAAHTVFASVKNLSDLTIFMRHHVYCVWDFMSLVKYLQQSVAPAAVPWIPNKNAHIAHFINAIVLEEESDRGLSADDSAPTFTSHFNLYIDAMQEVVPGSARDAEEFVECVKNHSLAEALRLQKVPEASEKFIKSTFAFIDTDKPHIVAAAFAFGREHIIPSMFRALLEKMSITKEQAPTFHYYLERHIELDGDFHGPMALEMVDILCEGDPIKIEEAENAAISAIKHRMAFWDELLLKLHSIQ